MRLAGADSLTCEVHLLARVPHDTYVKTFISIQSSRVYEFNERFLMSQ